MHTFVPIQSNAEHKDVERRSFFLRALGVVPDVSIAITITLLLCGAVPVHAVSKVVEHFCATSLLSVGLMVDWVTDPMVGLVSAQSPLIANWFASLPHGLILDLYLGSLAVASLWLTSAIIMAPLSHRASWRDIVSW